jgi:hypothetical protein
MAEPSALPVVQQPTEKQRKEVQELISETVGLGISGKKGPIKIFICFREREENIYLVKDVLDPILTALSFEVHYWIKDRKFGDTDAVIYAMMDSCNIVIGLYTNDDKIEGNGFKPAGNVVHEMGREKPRNKVILNEEDTIIETLSYPRIPNISFTRNKYEKLLVDLFQFLKNSGFLADGL